MNVILRSLVVLVLVSGVFAGSAQAQFVRGDVDNDGIVSLPDPLATLSYLFISGSPVPVCLDACDTDDDGSVDLTDALGVLNFLFVTGSAAPAAPFPDAGADPTADSIPGDCGGGLGGPLPFEQIELGTQSSAPPQDVIFRDAAAWNTFWAQHTITLPTPAVDFGTEMVIVLLRSVPTGGYFLQIDAITDAVGEIIVEYTFGAPLSQCPVTFALTQPFHIVKTTNVPGSLVTVETLVDSCP